MHSSSDSSLLADNISVTFQVQVTHLGCGLEVQPDPRAPDLPPLDVLPSSESPGPNLVAT